MKKRVIAFILLIHMFVGCFTPVSVHAQLYSAAGEIRVGLEALYAGKESITIHNLKLGYGYCVGNSYLQETEFISAEGFTFSVANGYYVSEQIRYGSYLAAKQAAEAYRAKGIEAWPGSVYQCSWRVYFTGTSQYEDADKRIKSIAASMGRSEAEYEILPENSYRMLLSGSFGKIMIDVDGRYSYPQFRPMTEYENGVFCVDMGKRDYRGRMEIGRYGKATLTAVNIVPLEEYLYSVVPSEMSASWHEEALKAQAVCSRSYALIKAGYGGTSNAKKGYKIVDTVSSQVYRGVQVESDRSTAAVNATKGKLLVYKNKVVSAYFFSTSGGSTEAAEDVWSVKKEYLSAVPDFYEGTEERSTWQVTLSVSEIGKLLKSHGVNLGSFLRFDTAKYSDTGRMYALTARGTNRFVTLQGTTIRTVLNLFSTKFTIVKKGDVPDKVSVLSAEGMSEGKISDMYLASASGVAKASEEAEQYIVQSADNLWNYPRLAPTKEGELLFAGMGYGHGVGMSQYGAKGMAEAGYNYKEILEYYFTGAYVR